MKACILTVGSVRKEVNFDLQNKLSFSNICSFYLSCDHRVIDGAIGAKWLQEFKKLIENPEKLFL